MAETEEREEPEAAGVKEVQSGRRSGMESSNAESPLGLLQEDVWTEEEEGCP